eukprot:TRINITY_DN6427_c1_g1_i1.p1 TRINITY_DN6427_c1_g1~~TRINITY_DN6427_c1_g1_i1.p1  ORF type:complete len:266 (+),score=52.03 TRINITY_DN6427_c1_g1_i1:71-868(+)
MTQLWRVAMAVGLLSAAAADEETEPPRPRPDQIERLQERKDLSDAYRDFIEKEGTEEMLESLLNPSCQLPGLQFGLSGKDMFSWVCCSSNHRYAEHAGYLLRHLDTRMLRKAPSITFYDSVCGVPLYTIGTKETGRSISEWWQESASHGWPSFRSREIHRNHVEMKESGEVVSSCGTHLGHNLPDIAGERHCINLLCISGFEGDSGSQNEMSSLSLSPSPARTVRLPDPNPTGASSLRMSPAAMLLAVVGLILLFRYRRVGKLKP